MLVLVSCLLFVTISALATDPGPYMSHQPFQAPQNYPPYHSNHPKDYDHHSVKPDSQLYFSFEQLRRDQPPQVDVREENIGRYMHRALRTTTTPIPIFNTSPTNSPDFNKEYLHRFPEVNIPQEQHLGQQWNPDYSVTSSTMAPPPPPPSPKWQDLSRDFSHQTYSQYHPAPRWTPSTEHNMPETHRYQQSPVPSTAEPIQWSDPTQNINHRHDKQITVPQSISSLPQTASEEYSPSVTTPHQLHNRGNHKFNWNDVTANENVKVNLTPEPLIKAPPPPVPSLTPWYGDNF